MHTFKATGVSIGGSKAIRAEEGNWVDVGKQHISLSVIMPESPNKTDSEDQPPDLVDIYYSKLCRLADLASICKSQCKPGPAL